MRSRLVWVLISLQFLLGLGAAVSGALLILAPDGHYHADAAVYAQNDAVRHVSASRNLTVYLCGNLSTCRCL